MAKKDNIKSYRQVGQRKNLPTDQTERYMSDQDRKPVIYKPDPRERNGRPVLAWAREVEDAPEIMAHPLYVQEKIHPGAFVSTLCDDPNQSSFFADFNGLPDQASYEWYQHQGYWQNRIVRGPNREVMASLLAKEEMAGKVQMIYFDPPYGMGYEANFQAHTRKREGEQTGSSPNDSGAIRAFRDNYCRGIHSYLDETRQSLVVSRELLAEQGSLFVQIGKQNVNRIALLLDEVFGEENRIAMISFATSGSSSGRFLPEIAHYLLWYAKSKKQAKYQHVYEKLNRKEIIDLFNWHAMLELENGTERRLADQERIEPDNCIPTGAKIFKRTPLDSQGVSTTGRSDAYEWNGVKYKCPAGSQWRVSMEGMDRLAEKRRLTSAGIDSVLRWKTYEDEVPGRKNNNIWSKKHSATDKHYVVETAESVIEQCLLMTTDPGDLVLDPTAGSGTTAYVAEKWGRRWITIDASAVGISLTRQRIATGIFAYNLLQDSAEGAQAESLQSATTGIQKTVNNGPFQDDVGKGFVYERVPTVSAAILAYDQEIAPTLLVNRPIKKLTTIRVSSPFTVESHSPYRCVSPEQVLARQVDDAGLTDNVLRALENSGILVGTDRLPVTDVHRLKIVSSDTFGVSHECMVNGESAGIVIVPEDCTVGEHLVTRAANDCRKLPELNKLLLIGFAYESSRGEYIDRRGQLTVLKLQANQDLRIQQLKDERTASAFAVVGEPDVAVVLAPDNSGKLICKVLGYDTYNPLTGQIEEGYENDIACFMVDTNHDGKSFYARRIHFPGGKADKQILRFARTLRRFIKQELWEKTFSLETAPFDKPASGMIAVRIVTCTHTEMTKEIDVSAIGN